MTKTEKKHWENGYQVRGYKNYKQYSYALSFLSLGIILFWSNEFKFTPYQNNVSFYHLI